MWMRSCAACKAGLRKLRMGDSVRCNCGWVWVGPRSDSAPPLEIMEAPEPNEVAMAKVIEFYIPTSLRKPLRTSPQPQLGKIIEFCPQKKKSA